MDNEPRDRKRVEVMRSLWMGRCSCQVLATILERLAEGPSEPGELELRAMLTGLSHLLTLVGSSLEMANATVGSWE